jgi:hypothetical protein
MKERDTFRRYLTLLSLLCILLESRRHGCPKLQINIAGEEIQAFFDSGYEMSVLNEGFVQ